LTRRDLRARPLLRLKQFNALLTPRAFIARGQVTVKSRHPLELTNTSSAKGFQFSAVRRRLYQVKRLLAGARKRRESSLII